MSKKINVYSGHLTSDFYSSCPKAVFAALAVSLMANHLATDVDFVEQSLLKEWNILYENGIVPQRPPSFLFKLDNV